MNPTETGYSIIFRKLIDGKESDTYIAFFISKEDFKNETLKEEKDGSIAHGIRLLESKLNGGELPEDLKSETEKEADKELKKLRGY
jgi:hypothetical protein